MKQRMSPSKSEVGTRISARRIRSVRVSGVVAVAAASGIVGWAEAIAMRACGSFPRPLNGDKPMTTQPITTALFDFLRDLRENNDREWFAANKGRYLAEVRDPMLDFIGAFAAPLAEISPHFVADPAAERRIAVPDLPGHAILAGQDAIQDERGGAFPPRRRERTRTRPASISHLEPGMCFAGCGVWRPDGPTVTKIREAIDVERDAWTRVTTARDFTETFELEGDSLKRAAAGLRGRPPAGGGPEAPGFRCGYEFFGGRSAPGRLRGVVRWHGAARERRWWSFCRLQ